MKKPILSLCLLGALIMFSCISVSSVTFAAGSSAQAQVPHSTRSFKQACTQVESGYASCLALISTSTVAAPATNVVNSAAAAASKTANVAQPYAIAPGGSAPYTPTNLHTAYNLPTQASSEQTVAIIDAYDDPNAESDMNAYRSQFGIPSCTSASGCFTKINQTGGTTYPTADSGWAEEISLDLDMVSAICQNCHILLVEANTANFSDLGTAVNTAVSKGANEISNSYGGSQSISDSSICDSYYNHSGVAITASSGDGGPLVEAPADCPNVVAVGGTTLNSNGTETDWNTSPIEGAGGGCSFYTSHPSWENSSVTSCLNRAVADVSAVADPNTGVYMYDTYQASGWYQIGGTSASSPIIASVYALAGGVSGNAASIPWSNYTSGCLSLVNGDRYSYQGGLGSPNGIGCF